MASGSPRWVWVFTPLVALCFVGFLFYLTTVPATDDIENITQSLNAQAKQALNETVQAAIKQELPAAIKSDGVDQAVDNYQFFEILENKKVSVEKVAEYTSTPKGFNKDGKKIQYRLKAGSFRTHQRAERMKAQLTLNGFDTQIESAEINNRIWYRVFTGPFGNRSKMNGAQDRLVALGINSVSIKQTLP
ncbi:MAG: SPOR domain-containing protein [Bermanella sp.]